MKRLTILLLLLASACGDESPTILAANVRLDALMKDNVKSLTLFVLGPKGSDGVYLTCNQLMLQKISPTDPRVEGLGKSSVSFADATVREFEVTDIEAGDGRIVYVEAYDSAGALYANGCTSPVTVESNSTVDVEIVLYEV